MEMNKNCKSEQHWHWCYAPNLLSASKHELIFVYLHLIDLVYCIFWSAGDSYNISPDALGTIWAGHFEHLALVVDYMVCNLDNLLSSSINLALTLEVVTKLETAEPTRKGKKTGHSLDHISQIVSRPHMWNRKSAGLVRPTRPSVMVPPHSSLAPP